MNEPEKNIPYLTEDLLNGLHPWVRLADSFGIPRSIGQLYGLLFMSKQALSAQECAEMLKISRSSAGQGLRNLKESGAIQSNFHLGDRSERFVVEPDLGVMLQSILLGRLLPAFDTFFQSMKSLDILSTNEDFYKHRVEKLGRWEEKFMAAVIKVKKDLK
jgi:DNA-binding transcriptional regulator GbsR (MarR family)